MAEGLKQGAIVAGHRVERLLGRGGMATVYLARHLHLGRTVALKVLDADLGRDRRFRERFVGESRAAAEIDHPNVIPIYDAGEEDDVLYLAMRFVAGTDLREVLAQEAPLSPERTCALLAQVGAALDAAHRHGLVHRDVKPANILLTRNERGGEHVYLTDFGISKRMTDVSSLTAAGEFLGTLDYVSPEQVHGQPTDGRTDEYALACVAVQCLTGRVPYPSGDIAALVHAHATAAAPSVVALRPELPATVDAVLARGMAKQPDERFGSCTDLIDALAGALGPAAQRAVEVARASRPVDTGSTTMPGAPPAAVETVRAARARRRRVRRLRSVLLAVAVIAAMGSAGALGVALERNRGGDATSGSTTPAPTRPPFAPHAPPRTIDLGSAISPGALAAGASQTVWFTVTGAFAVGYVGLAGLAQQCPLTPPAGAAAPTAVALAASPDGTMWFAGAGVVGRIGPGCVRPIVAATPRGTTLTGIALGPDHRTMWATSSAPTGSALLHFPAQAAGGYSVPDRVDIYPVAGSDRRLAGICAGGDGSVWAVEEATDAMVLVGPTGIVREFHLPTQDATPTPGSCAAAPDGHVWVTIDDRLWRLPYSGDITGMMRLTNVLDAPGGLVVGRDRALYWTEHRDVSPAPGDLPCRVGRIDTAHPEAFPVYIELPPGGLCDAAATGPDDNLWVAEPGLHRIDTVLEGTPRPLRDVPLAQVSAYRGAEASFRAAGAALVPGPGGAVGPDARRALSAQIAAAYATFDADLGRIGFTGSLRADVDTLIAADEAERAPVLAASTEQDPAALRADAVAAQIAEASVTVRMNVVRGDLGLPRADVLGLVLGNLTGASAGHATPSPLPGARPVP